MITLQSLKKSISADLKFDKTKLDSAAAENPHLVQKYLDLYTSTLMQMKDLDAKYAKLYRDKMVFYRTKWEFVPDTLKELEAFISGDDQIIDIRKEIKELNTIIQYLKETVQTFRDRAWAIKNIIEWHKFTEGVN